MARALHILDVYLQDKFAGKLTSNAGELSFTYDPAYIHSGVARKLSASMPLQEAPFGHTLAAPFFSGLLPDEKVRTQLAKYLHLSEQNTFGLLGAIGGECAGAVALYPEDRSPQTMDEPRYLILNAEEADKILTSLDRQPFLAGEDDVRISGAGAQKKLMIALMPDEKIAIPLGNTASTYIIKPPIQNIMDSVYNELFCMRLAEKIGLPVPRTRILRVYNKLYYIIARYDRFTDSDGITRRLHQEDFCQALNIPPEIKYENEGGPSLEECFKLLDACIATGSMAGMHRLTLLKGVMFNFLIGNGDAHGKNFSLLYTEKGEGLAPFYDLLCTQIYSNAYKAKMAMKIDGKYLFKDVYPCHWENLANTLGFKPKFVIGQLEKMAASIVPEALALKKELEEKGHTSPVYDHIIEVIEKHAKQSLS